MQIPRERDSTPSSSKVSVQNDIPTPSTSSHFIEEKTETREGTGFVHKHVISCQQRRSQNPVLSPSLSLSLAVGFSLPVTAVISYYELPIVFFPRHPQLRADSKLGVEEPWHVDVELREGPGGPGARGGCQKEIEPPLPLS